MYYNYKYQYSTRLFDHDLEIEVSSGCVLRGLLPLSYNLKKNWCLLKKKHWLITDR